MMPPEIDAKTISFLLNLYFLLITELLLGSIFMKSLFRQRTPPNPHATQMDNNTKYTTQLDKNTKYTTHTTFSEKNLRQVKCHHTLEKTVSTDHVNNIDSISVFFIYFNYEGP